MKKLMFIFLILASCGKTIFFEQETYVAMKSTPPFWFNGLYIENMGPDHVQIRPDSGKGLTFIRPFASISAMWANATKVYVSFLYVDTTMDKHFLRIQIDTTKNPFPQKYVVYSFQSRGDSIHPQEEPEGLGTPHGSVAWKDTIKVNGVPLRVGQGNSFLEVPEEEEANWLNP
jgi:hypothetical protein